MEHGSNPLADLNPERNFAPDCICRIGISSNLRNVSICCKIYNCRSLHQANKNIIHLLKSTTSMNPKRRAAKNCIDSWLKLVEISHGDLICDKNVDLFWAIVT